MLGLQERSCGYYLGLSSVHKTKTGICRMRTIKLCVCNERSMTMIDDR